jgi:hypothetical protein
VLTVVNAIPSAIAPANNPIRYFLLTVMVSSVGKGAPPRVDRPPVPAPDMLNDSAATIFWTRPAPER